MVSSWEVKLVRARAHIDEATALAARASSEIRIEESREGDLFTYGMMCEAAVPDMLPVIVGDALFNLRSALDHVLVASVSDPSIKSVQFPIFNIDPVRGTRRDRDLWASRIRGAPRVVVDLVILAQPYRSANPEHTALALLSELQNADKHRELLTLVVGVIAAIFADRQSQSTFSIQSDGMFPAGATIAIDKWKRDISVLHGDIDFAIRAGELKHYRLLQMLNSIHEEVSAITQMIGREIRA